MPLRFPIARSCKAGRKADLKVDSHSIGGWMKAADIKWVSDLTQDELHLTMVRGGEVEQFELHLVTDGSGGVVIRQGILAGNFWGYPHSYVIPADTPVPAGDCGNYWVGDRDDVERKDDTTRNNGWAVRIEHPLLLAVQLWPKREDRIRADIIRMGSITANLEFDTRNRGSNSSAPTWVASGEPKTPNFSHRRPVMPSPRFRRRTNHELGMEHLRRARRQRRPRTSTDRVE